MTEFRTFSCANPVTGLTGRPRNLSGEVAFHSFELKKLFCRMGVEMRFSRWFGAVAVTAIPFAAVAAPVTVDITQVTGNWTATTGTTATGIGTNTISWGVPTFDGEPQSSYVFQGAAPPTIGPFAAGDVFNIGEFTHNNFPIFAPSITGATLEVETTGAATNGSTVPFTLTSIFQFGHNETVNEPSDASCAFGGSVPCPDVVTVMLDAAASESILIDGTEYVVAVTGFEGIPGGSFLTLENQSNDAVLQASFIQRTEVIPVPAALPLLFSGLVMLAFASRRRRA